MLNYCMKRAKCLPATCLQQKRIVVHHELLAQTYLFLYTFTAPFTSIDRLLRFPGCPVQRAWTSSDDAAGRETLH
jgi:hypothetical protein